MAENPEKVVFHYVSGKELVIDMQSVRNAVDSFRQLINEVEELVNQFRGPPGRVAVLYVEPQEEEQQESAELEQEPMEVDSNIEEGYESPHRESRWLDDDFVLDEEYDQLLDEYAPLIEHE